MTFLYIFRKQATTVEYVWPEEGHFGREGDGGYNVCLSNLNQPIVWSTRLGKFRSSILSVQ